MRASTAAFAVRNVLVAVFALSLAACGGGGMRGMGEAAQQTGAKFDKYGCLARELKGEAPCEPEQPAQ